MRVVFDTGALSLFFADNKTVKDYMKQIVDKNIKGYVPQVILAEFFYKMWKKFGKEIAEIRLVALRNSPLNIINIEEQDIHFIGELKVKYSKLSLADAILCAAALRVKGKILTTETELLKVKKVKSIKLQF